MGLRGGVARGGALSTLGHDGLLLRLPLQAPGFEVNEWCVDGQGLSEALEVGAFCEKIKGKGLVVEEASVAAQDYFVNNQTLLCK